MTNVTHQKVTQPETHTWYGALVIQNPERLQSLLVVQWMSCISLALAFDDSISFGLQILPGPDKRTTETRGICLCIYQT